MWYLGLLIAYTHVQLCGLEGSTCGEASGGGGGLLGSAMGALFESQG